MPQPQDGYLAGPDGSGLGVQLERGSPPHGVCGSPCGLRANGWAGY